MIPAPSASSDNEDGSGFLGHCLVESDGSQEQRERRNKQRALIISIVVQVLIVAALVLFPLFSEGENIASRVILSPTVPYARGNGHPRQKPNQQQRRTNQVVCRICQPDHIPTGIVTRDSAPPTQTTEESGEESDLSHVGTGGNERGVDFVISDRRPDQPREEGTVVSTPTIRRQVSEPVQQAMLIHRVEPIYPVLALQTRREGRVLLHALISAEGHIESLQVVSGDPMFIRSALDAVGQWRYRATLLNGQAVEVETYISVIYTISH